MQYKIKAKKHCAKVQISWQSHSFQREPAKLVNMRMKSFQNN